MTFSRRIVRELLQNSVTEQCEVEKVYALLPVTSCRRRTHCCLVLPEMTLLEALMAIHRLVRMAPAMRRQLIKKLVTYFFLNAVEITSCPFLDGVHCLIYRDRFFGCRAYGLWSPGFYEELETRNRKAKIPLQKQWQNLGISLPQIIIDFQVPYCPFVETEDHALIDDDMLLDAWERIERLSQRFSFWHQAFHRRYFSDLSFLLASLTFGFTDVIKQKLAVVSDIVTDGDKGRLDRIVAGLPDLCAELT